MFTTDQSYPVLTRGHGSQVEMMIMRRAGGSSDRDMGAVGTSPASSSGKRAIGGMFRYMADAATFTDCQTGQRWPVAMEGEYKALEAAYLEARRQPADELLVNLEGQVVMRPNPDTGRPAPTLMVEHYIGIRPEETCEAPLAAAPLQETYWKLTRLGDQPVIVAEKQREPSLVLRTQQSRVAGFGGCNNLTGNYELNGSELTFGPIAATSKACLEGMDTEGALFKALERVRAWKILGQHLELYDGDGNLVARFEARALR
jgi:copper homeostasis protein (lipoprotein)